ncbi:MAG: hypothetical protein AABX84_00815 [Nanoarchaeota archaeon]
MVEYLAIAFGRKNLMKRLFGVLFLYEEENEIDFNKFHEREKEDILTVLYKGPSDVDARKALSDSGVYVLSEDEVVSLIPLEDMEKFKLFS